MEISLAMIVANLEDRRGAAALEVADLERRLKLQRQRLDELRGAPWWRPYRCYSRWRLRRAERHTEAEWHEAAAQADAYGKATEQVTQGRYDFAINLLRSLATQVRLAGQAQVNLAQTLTEQGILLQQAEELATELEAMAGHLEDLRAAKARS